jgi:hypothetical protein
MARANGFTAHDLETNRGGAMTRPQTVRVFLQALKPLRLAGAALAGWLLMLLVIHTLLPGILEGFVIKKLGMGTAFGVVLAFVMALLKCSRRTVLLIADARDGKIDTVVGRVAPSFEENEADGLGRWRGEKVPVYHYCIREEAFEVTRAAYGLLISKYDTYRPLVRLYFTPRSKLLLAVEPVEGSSIAKAAEQEGGHWVFQAASEPMTVEPTYFAVRRNDFDALPRQWSATVFPGRRSAKPALKPKPVMRQPIQGAARPRPIPAVRTAPPPNLRPGAGTPLPRHSGTPKHPSAPPAG